MEFVEFPAPASLAPFVECCWTLDGESRDSDGCVELVLGREGTRVGVERDEHGRSRALSSFVLGLTTRPFRVSYARLTACAERCEDPVSGAGKERVMSIWLFALALTSSPQGLELTGTVRGPAGPLDGATVFVATARPRRGVGIL